MTTYRYKGQTKDGTAVSGVIRAYDEFEAASRLRETVAIITRLEEVREKKENIFNRPIGLKIKEKELALICSQFAIILSAGMSIQHCVEMVAAQTRNRHIRQMLEKVAEEVGAGYSMAQSFENNAPYLPKTFIETVRAGEQSGTLEECFQRLHRYYDKSAKTKAKVVSALTYPAMVIVVAIVVFIIIIAVAVPAFNDVFAEMDTQLPGITRVLLATSDFFVGWWWLLLLIAAGLWKRRFAAGAAELLARYGAERPEDILGRASAYREACVVAAEAAKKREAVEQALAGHIARDEETRRRLLELVHPFAPTVTDTFGVSAALSRALNLDERLSTARVKLEGARTLADSLPRPEEVSGGTDVEPRFDPAETAARLSAAEGELSRLRSGLAMAQGELNTLGDREALQTRREAIQEELDRRRAEYDALGAALAALEQAHSGLQARFSPALNRRAGELLAALTGGKYDKVALTQQFEALAEERDGLQPRRALTLSQGTADQLYLAVRLAVCELVLPAEEPCPLVLDDALANFDDGRCALALEALARLGEERQILLFTCHSREARLAEGREGAAVLRLQS